MLDDQGQPGAPEGVKQKCEETADLSFHKDHAGRSEEEPGGAQGGVKRRARLLSERASGVPQAPFPSEQWAQPGASQTQIRAPAAPTSPRAGQRCGGCPGRLQNVPSG